MKRFLPSTEKVWASAGLVPVILIAICGKGPQWIATAAVIYGCVCTALLWSLPEAEVEKGAEARNTWENR